MSPVALDRHWMYFSTKTASTTFYNKTPFHIAAWNKLLARKLLELVRIREAVYSEAERVCLSCDARHKARTTSATKPPAVSIEQS